MIVIDFSQIIISNLMVEIGNRKDIPLDVNLLRHVVVNTIRSHKVKFSREYGDVVIACDNKKYWRKQHFPNYKANRKKAREESGMDWAMIFDSINLIKEEFKQFFPYRVLDIEGAEADDVIATLAEWSSRNNLVQNGLIEEPESLLIISGDHDFYQLQKYRHVKQYAPVQKKFIKGETTPEKYVIEHIIRGDKGDGIPNVLSDDDVFIQDIRQKSISSKKLEEWVSNPDSMPGDRNFTRNYQRNRTLIDFDYIPQEIKDRVINTFIECPPRGKEKLIDYFIANRMKQMIEHVEEF